MSRRVIVVLGGNAFVSPGRPLTMAGQFRYASEAVSHLKPLLGADTELLISHGNGPQVGHILTRVEQTIGQAYSLPLEVCVAESEGELGYLLQQVLYNQLIDSKVERSVVCLLSQVVVDSEDPAFNHPTKPVGPFLDAKEAQRLREVGQRVAEDSGRGLRRVVASPQPIEILEEAVIRQLLEQNVIVIAAGGGGIPVVREEGHLHGVEAVIDKDSTAALLGVGVDAELLVILTGVPAAYRHFRTPSQSPIGQIKCQQAEKFLREGHFAPGSMRPKIEAAVRFASRGHRRSIICDPFSLEAALRGEAGTIIEQG